LTECIFCRIAAGEVPADIVHRDERAVAFRDIRPQAPTHVLVVPRRHWTSLAEVPSGEEALLGHLLALCRDLARRLGLEGGYRVVVNTGADGGQTVGHLHLHLLGGRAMQWPPG
jgi:histidine triad (HIT) family protein